MNHATSSLNWNSCRILSSKRIIPVILVISSIYLDHDEVPVLIKNCSWGKFEHLETHFIYSVTWKHNENIPNGILSLPDHLSVANFSIIARFLKRTPRSILQIQKRRRRTECFNSITQKSKIKKIHKKYCFGRFSTENFHYSFFHPFLYLPCFVLFCSFETNLLNCNQVLLYQFQFRSRW